MKPRLLACLLLLACASGLAVASPALPLHTVSVELGVRVIETTDQLRKALGVDADRGALVAEVQSGGPADRAGLRAGDVLIRVAGKPVGDPSDVLDALEHHRVGDDVMVHYVRRGEARSANVKLARAEPPRMRMGPWSVPLPGGVAPEKLEHELRRFRERVERQFRDLEDGSPPA
jgi:hypothetical protein